MKIYKDISLNGDTVVLSAYSETEVKHKVENQLGQGHIIRFEES